MSEKKRFVDKGKYYWQFWDHIFVKCPNCSSQALVRQDKSEAKFYAARVSCVHCGYNESTSSTSWKGPVTGIINRKCPYCGRSINKRLKGPKYLKFAHIKCECEFEFDEPIDWRPILNDRAMDPFFGLPLWFTDHVLGHNLWAYNREHLKFLKNVVEAEIREVKTAYRTLSVSLPKWMLAGKHRAEILKAIDRISKM